MPKENHNSVFPQRPRQRAPDLFQELLAVGGNYGLRTFLLAQCSHEVSYMKLLCFYVFNGKAILRTFFDIKKLKDHDSPLRRSGLFCSVLRRDCSKRHFSISGVLPPISISGTFQPKKSAGLV